MHVKRLISAPAYELDLARERPPCGGMVGDTHVEVAGQGQLGREVARVERGNADATGQAVPFRQELSGGLEQGIDFADQLVEMFLVGVVQGDVAFFHLGGHFRTVGDADGQLVVDVEHGADIESQSYSRVALQGDGSRRRVVINRHFLYDRLHDRLQHGEHLGILGGDGLRHVIGHVSHLARPDQGATHGDVAKHHHQPGADAQPVGDAPREGGLDVKGLQGNVLHEVRAGPIVAPFDAAPIGRVDREAGGQEIVDLEAGVGVEGRAWRVVGALLETIAFNRRVGEDTRETRGEVDRLIHKRQSRGVEVHAFRAEFQGDAHVAHAGLFRALRVDLKSLGSRVGERERGQAGQREYFFHHIMLYLFVMS